MVKKCKPLYDSNFLGEGEDILIHFDTSWVDGTVSVQIFYPLSFVKVHRVEYKKLTDNAAATFLES